MLYTGLVLNSNRKMIDFIGLEIIEFHDLPLKNLEIIEQPVKSLKLEALDYDDSMECYWETTIVFEDLQLIEPEIIPIDDYSDAEIFSFDYELSGGFFCGKLKCLLGFGKPDFDLEFTCREVKISQKN